MGLEVNVDRQVTLGWARNAKILGFDLRLNFFEACLRGENLVAAPWEERQGIDHLGVFRTWRRNLSWKDQKLLEEHIFLYEDAVRYEVAFPQGLSNLKGSRDFFKPAVIAPLFSFTCDSAYFLCTFGLDGESGGYPGGYWPEAYWGRVTEGFPQKPFAPLVLYDGEGAVAIAPGELFLLSPLIVQEGRIGRALAGDFVEIPAGTVLSTWFAFGKDPGEALRRLGELLLRAGKKERPDRNSTPILSRLGYWNAYGSYYTELIHPMEEGILRALSAEFRAKKIPVGYIGLDLWYPYERIGQALVFQPDPRKYPRGLGALRREIGIPFVLHLSALSPHNFYGTDGVDPAIYGEIAKEALRQGGIGIWHDWLRTWQFLTPALLSDPWRAEAWFSGMCQAFREAGLPILLCMETMGMVLASTRETNVVAARSYTDHLFSMRLALRRAAKAEPTIERAWQKPVQIWLQNLLVGYVQWALGLAPFHDLFLSRKHPGFGGEKAWEEAVLRALSSGPVGFGDACGMADPEILLRLVLPDGRLAQPDHPPEPFWPTLNTQTPIFWTEKKAGDLSWVYLLILNPGEEEEKVRLPRPYDGEFLVWDPKTRTLDGWEILVPAGGLAYRVLIPVVEGTGLLGAPELFVPMPTQAEVVREEGKLRIWAPEGVGLHAVFSSGKMVTLEELKGVETRRG